MTATQPGQGPINDGSAPASDGRDPSTGCAAAPTATQEPPSLEQCVEQIETLRAEGAWRVDPARFHALEALAQRTLAQPQPVRRILEERLRAALADYATRVDSTRDKIAQLATPLAARQPRLARELRALQASADLRGLRPLLNKAAPPPACALVPLNEHVRSISPSVVAAIAAAESEEHPELSSVRRFRRMWASSLSLERIDKAVFRKPEKAGPLNSHVLVLQSLSLMRELSPDYLRRFMTYVESLQWLEQASTRPPAGGGKSTKGGKGGKASKAGKVRPPAGRARK